MSKELEARLRMSVLQQSYEVLGGEDIEEVKAYRESSDMYNIRSKTRHRYNIRVPMILLKDDSDDVLPLFMMKLENGCMVTCYREKEEEFMDMMMQEFSNSIHQEAADELMRIWRRT